MVQIIPRGRCGREIHVYPSMRSTKLRISTTFSIETSCMVYMWNVATLKGGGGATRCPKCRIVGRSIRSFCLYSLCTIFCIIRCLSQTLSLLLYYTLDITYKHIFADWHILLFAYSHIVNANILIWAMCVTEIWNNRIASVKWICSSGLEMLTIVSSSIPSSNLLLVVIR